MSGVLLKEIKYYLTLRLHCYTLVYIIAYMHNIIVAKK